MLKTAVSYFNSENWLPVVGYARLYEVSDLGRVRSCPRLRANGVWAEGRVLRPGPQRRGYLTVCLIGPDGSKRSKRVHRLVLESFVGPCPAGFMACHFNDVPGDNRLSNLRWASRSENHVDAVRNRRFGLDQSACVDCGVMLADDDYYRSPVTGLASCVACRSSWAA